MYVYILYHTKPGNMRFDGFLKTIDVNIIKNFFLQFPLMIIAMLCLSEVINVLFRTQASTNFPVLQTANWNLTACHE